MSTLLLRLEGPLQAWGVGPRLDLRQSAPWPTKSGVVGLLREAMGLPWEARADSLAQLPLAVAVLRPGRRLVDLQTVQGVVAAEKDELKNKLTLREYLADAAFLAALEGPEELMQKAQAALLNPAQEIFLGRRGCLPSPPVALPEGLSPLPLLEALQSELKRRGRQQAQLVLEAPVGQGRMIHDVPVGRFFERRFAPRFVREETWRLS